MSTTLKEVIEVVKPWISARPKSKKSIADEFLGKFKGIIPRGKTSTQFIKELRGSLYGKIK